MLDAQTSKLKMFMRVKQNMNDHRSVWENIPYIASSVAALHTIIEGILDTGGIQMFNRTGFAVDKKVRRERMVKSAMLVVSILKSYATFSGNKLLREQIHFTPSKFKNFSGNDALVAAGTVIKLANEHQAGAANFGLTQAFLDALSANHTDFANYINAPADARKERKEATATIKTLLAEGDVLLKERLFNDLEIFADTHREFYLVMVIGRKIGNPMTIKLGARCKITDAETGQPLPGARVVIKDHNINRKSTPKGQILVRNLGEGNHTVKVSMKGYVSQAVKITHITGETTVVNVEMVKEE